MRTEDADFDWTCDSKSGVKMLILIGPAILNETEGADFDWTCDSA